MTVHAHNGGTCTWCNKKVTLQAYVLHLKESKMKTFLHFSAKLLVPTLISKCGNILLHAALILKLL